MQWLRNSLRENKQETQAGNNVYMYKSRQQWSFMVPSPSLIFLRRTYHSWTNCVLPKQERTSSLLDIYLWWSFKRLIGIQLWIEILLLPLSARRQRRKPADLNNKDFPSGKIHTQLMNSRHILNSLTVWHKCPLCSTEYRFICVSQRG